MRDPIAPKIYPLREAYTVPAHVTFGFYTWTRARECGVVFVRRFFTISNNTPQYSGTLVHVVNPGRQAGRQAGRQVLVGGSRSAPAV